MSFPITTPSTAPTAGHATTVPVTQPILVTIIFDTSLPRSRFLQSTGKQGEIFEFLGRIQAIENQRVAVSRSSIYSASSTQPPPLSKSKEILISTIITTPTTTHPLLHTRYFAPIPQFLNSLSTLTSFFSVEGNGSGCGGGKGKWNEDDPFGLENDFGFGYGIGKSGKDEDLMGNMGKDKEERKEKEKEKVVKMETEVIDLDAEEQIVPEIQTTQPLEPETGKQGENGQKQDREDELENGLLEGFISALEMFDLYSRRKPSLPFSSFQPFRRYIPQTTRSISESTDASVSSSYVLVFSARDPLIYIPSSETKKTGEWVENKEGMGIKLSPGQTDLLESNSTLNPGGHLSNGVPASKLNISTNQSGLPSPSPSPEDDKNRHSPIIRQPPSNPDSNRFGLWSSKGYSSSKGLRRRVRSNWTTCLDHVTWGTLTRELEKRDVVLGVVLSSGYEGKEGGALTGLSGLLKGAKKKENGESKVKENKWQEEAWWRVEDKEKVILTGWTLIDNLRTSTSAPTLLPEIKIETGKNNNGKRPLSTIVSPPTQGSQVDSKRMKVEQPTAVLAAAAQLNRKISTGAISTNLAPQGSSTGNNNNPVPMGNHDGSQNANEVNMAAQKVAMLQQQARASQLMASQQMEQRQKAATMSMNNGVSVPNQNTVQVPEGQGQGQGSNQNAGQSSNGLLPPVTLLPAQQKQSQLQQSRQQQQPTQTNIIRPSPLEFPRPAPIKAGDLDRKIWEGRISMSAGTSASSSNGSAQQTPDPNNPAVVAVPVSKNADLGNFAVGSWPQGELRARGGLTLDIFSIQKCVQSNQCHFVEFLPQPLGDTATMNRNNFSFCKLTASMYTKKFMLRYDFGPQPGCGLLLLPHRSNEESAIKMLGACFFKQPIPPHLRANASQPGANNIKPPGQQPNQAQQNVQKPIMPNLAPGPAQVQRPQLLSNPSHNGNNNNNTPTFIQPQSINPNSLAALAQNPRVFQQFLNKAGLGSVNISTMDQTGLMALGAQLQAMAAKNANRANQPENV